MGNTLLKIDVYHTGELFNSEETRIVAAYVCGNGLKYSIGFILGRRYLKIMLLFLQIHISW